ncbi:ATP-binding protein [Streptomyces sp. NPDC048191]|uniref:ATP-binding protein n=1 Tax=Streptomyces sp. NPDC048191 TaxID=3155484 RepID=UPI0033C7D9A6
MTSTAVHTRTTVSHRALAAGTEVSIKRDPASTPDRLTEADAAWPARLRRIVRAALKYWRRADLAETVELLTTELLTNALRHGTGPDVGYRLSLRDDQLLIEVRDGSPAVPELRHATPYDENGRGLFIVDAMADAWGVSPDGTTTWCSLSLRKGPDDPMQPTAATAPVLREYRRIGLPAEPIAIRRVRTAAPTALLFLGWHGDQHAAVEVLTCLVDNALAYGVEGDTSGEPITVRLAVTERSELIIDVEDPNPKFPHFADAQDAEAGTGLWMAQSRRRAEVSWFLRPDGQGKTVRAVMTPGEVEP